MTKAVAYARYSSEQQREESIEAQLDHISAYAKTKGIVIVQEYIDRAISGKAASDRAAFMQMIKDAREQNWDLILVHKSNRFARNREEAAIYKHKLRKAGVTVKAVAQDFGEGSHAVLMEALMEGLDEFYSLELATETMKTLKVNASKCQYNGGRVLYGYRVNESKHYEIEPSDAAAIKDIFTKIADGWSYSEVLRFLEESGVRSREGKPFGKNSLHGILRNERYTGVYIFNEKPRRHPVTGKRSSRIKNSQDKIIKIPGGIPEVVPRELWEAVQIIMDSRKANTTARKRKYLLTGFIKCEMCGNAYIGITSTTQYTEKSYYRCSSKSNKPGSCKSKNVSLNILEDKLETFVHKTLYEINPQKTANLINEIIANETHGASQKIKSLKEALRDINNKIENLLVALENGDTGGMINKRLADHVAAKETLQGQLKTLEAPQKVITPEMIGLQIEKLKLDDKSPEEKRAVFKKIGLSITINPDGSASYSFEDNGVTNCGVGDATRYLVKLFGRVVV